MRKEIDIRVTEEFIKVIPDIAFARVPDYFGEMVRNLKLDLLVPLDKERLLPKRPLIIWIIGGGWKAVSKSKFNVEMAPFAKAGFAVASIEYRTSGEDFFPAQIVDVKSAIRFLRANADLYNLDPDRFFVMGESAGGHLAALAATSGGVTEWDQGDYPGVSSRVQGCVDLYGICDFTNQPLYHPLPPLFGELRGEELLVGGRIEDHMDAAAALNPLTYADGSTPPFLIFHGAEDAAVPAHQSETLYEGLTARGVRADFYLIRGANHADSKFYQEETRRIILDFLGSIN